MRWGVKSSPPISCSVRFLFDQMLKLSLNEMERTHLRSPSQQSDKSQIVTYKAGVDHSSAKAPLRHRAVP